MRMVDSGPSVSRSSNAKAPKQLVKPNILGYDSLMNAVFSRRRTTVWLNALIVLVGVVAAVVLAWAVFFRPAFADQLIAISAIGLTLALVYFDPLLAFLIWLFFIPFAPFWRFDLHMPAGIPDLSYARVVGSVLTVYLVAQIALGRRKFMTITFFELAVPFFVIPLLYAAARSYHGPVAGLQEAFDAYLMPLLVYFIARQLIVRPEDMQKFAKTMAIIASIIAIAAIIEQFTGFAPFRFGSGAKIYTGEIRKVGSFLGNPAYVGLALALVVPLVMMLIIEAQGTIEKVGYLFILAILEMGIVATFNRSAMLGGTIGPLVLSFLNRRLWKYVLLILLIIALVLGLSWSLLKDTSVSTRLGAESPIDYRIEAIEIGMNIHRTAPFLGVGFGWFGRLAVDKGFWETGNIHVLPTTHNTYLNFLVSGGYALLGGYGVLILGLGATLIAVGWPRRKNRRFFPLYIQVGLAMFFVYFIPIAFFDNIYARYASMIFFASMGGIISATLNSSSPSSPTGG